MKILAVAALGCLLAALLGGSLRASRADHGPVYTVPVVQDHLTRAPERWVGRTVLVRGTVVPCLAIPTEGAQPCAALAPSTEWPASAILTLVQGDPPPVVALLRRLPFLGALLPAPQALHWGAVATYRVRLQAIPESSCGTGVCDEAVLLDAAP